jgi:hypothetical protein
MKNSTKSRFMTNDPAEALEDLRHRLSTLRQAVATLASNKGRQPGADNEGTVNGLIAALKRLDEIQKHPALQAINTNGGIKPISNFQKPAPRHERLRTSSSIPMGTAYLRDRPRDWTIYLVIAAFALGMMASPFIAGRESSGSPTFSATHVPNR